MLRKRGLIQDGVLGYVHLRNESGGTTNRVEPPTMCLLLTFLVFLTSHNLNPFSDLGEFPVLCTLMSQTPPSVQFGNAI